MAKITVDDLLNIEGNQVPADAKSYSTFVYGYPKVGKTTFINDLYGEKVLFLATERRHDAIPNAHVINIDSWAEFLKVMKLLKDPKLHEKYDAIALDTVSRFEAYCEQYVLSDLQVEDLSDLGWGKGFSAYNKELEKGLSLIEKSGYTPIFISHAKSETKKVLVSEATDEEKGVDGATVIKEDGKQYVEYQKTVPDIKTKFFNMINRISDNILFLDLSVDSKGLEHRKIFYRDNLTHLAGATFRHMPETTELSADAYSNAVKKAIESEGKDNIVEGKREQSKGVEYDFDNIMKEIAELGKQLQKDGKANERQKVIEEVLGKGRKVKDLDESQAEIASVLVDKLKEIA
mgnify:CR=1 FL=1